MDSSRDRGLVEPWPHLCEAVQGGVPEGRLREQRQQHRHQVGLEVAGQGHPGQEDAQRRQRGADQARLGALL